MSGFSDKVGAYSAEVYVAHARTGGLGWLIAAGWIVFPFALQTVFHPSDVIRLQYAFEGLSQPRVFTYQQLTTGFIEAVMGMCMMAIVQMVATVMFYRRVRLEAHGPVASPPLWPIAAILSGVIGNLAWLIGTGYFDIAGCIVGLSSAALTVGGEAACEQLGRDFVFGPSAAPSVQTLWD